MKLIVHKDRLIGGDGTMIDISEAYMSMQTAMPVAVLFADRRGDPHVSGTSFRKFELSEHGVQVAKASATGQASLANLRSQR